MITARLGASTHNLRGLLLADGLGRRRSAGSEELLILAPKLLLATEEALGPGGKDTARELPGPGILELLGVRDDAAARDDFDDLGDGVKDDV